MLNLNLKVVLYSNFEKINDSTDILLIDAYGEALKFYEVSKCVFLGKSIVKSLAENSGQNPVEPARFGCKIFHGPYVSNFNDEYKYLNSLSVTKKIYNSEDLKKSLIEEFQIDKNRDIYIAEKIKK